MNLPNPIHHSHHHKSKKNMRQYLLITTVVVAAIFLVLLINENKSDPTGAVISVKDLGGIIEETSKVVEKTTNPDSHKSADVPSGENKRSFSMTVNKIPSSNQEGVSVGLMDLAFTDIATDINVNNELLSLRDLDSISLSLSEFTGDFSFNEVGLTLDGSVRQLIVNGVTLSTNDGIKISFKDLNFDSLSLTDATLNNLKISQSKGFMVVGERLSYNIDDDLVSLGSFSGSVLLDRTLQESISFAGVVNSLSVDGGLSVGIN